MKEGWKVVKIKDICDKASSNIAQKDLNDNEGEYPIYGASGFIKNVDFYQRSEPYIGIVKDGSGVGRVSLYPAYSSLLGTLQYIIPKYENDISFVYYALQSLSLSKFSVGAAIPHIYFKDYGECEVAIPPLPEQHRIVKKLDAAFEKIDAMKAKAEKNIENAKALFQQTLAEELEPKEGWVEKKLGEVCDKVCNIKWQITTDSFKYIDLTSVDRETDNVECCQMINAFNAPSRAKQKVQKGDILFATTRPTLRRLCIINEDYNGAICSTGFCVLRPCSAIHSKWIFYSLKADIFYSYVEPLQKGASYPAITDGDVKCFVVNFPPLPEQQQIVTKLDNLSAKCKKLEEAERKTIAECDALKQAILRQAFNGEL